MKPKDKIARMIVSKWLERPLLLCCKLGIPDLIAADEISIEQISSQTDTHQGSLYRLMRALASEGIFEETGNKVFKNTELSNLLKSSALGQMAVFMGSGWHNKAWDQLEHSIRTGETAFNHVYGEPLFDWLEKNPIASAVFNNAMTGGASFKRKVIADSYDFSGIETIVDVGGGHGALLVSILEKHPELKGIVFDLPEVTKGANEIIESSGLSDRIEVISGNFFKEVPAGDCHIMSHIIHDWDDESCITILKNCRKTQKENGKSLVCECVVPEGNTPAMAKLMDLEMLVVTPGGRERTEKEFRTLFEKSGYELGKIVDTPAEMKIIEAV